MARTASEGAIGGIRGAWSLKLGVVRDPDAEGIELARVTRRMLGAESAPSIAVYICVVLFVPIGLMVGVATAQLGVDGWAAQLVALGFIALYGSATWLLSYLRRRQAETRLWREHGPSLREIAPIGDYPANPFSARQWRTYRQAKKGRVAEHRGVENQARVNRDGARDIHREIWDRATPFEA